MAPGARLAEGKTILLWDLAALSAVVLAMQPMVSTAQSAVVTIILPVDTEALLVVGKIIPLLGSMPPSAEGALIRPAEDMVW